MECVVVGVSVILLVLLFKREVIGVRRIGDCVLSVGLLI